MSPYGVIRPQWVNCKGMGQNWVIVNIVAADALVLNHNHWHNAIVSHQFHKKKSASEMNTLELCGLSGLSRQGE